ncbi:hypothetical protein HBI56_071030 [Parastagonospora nodorum]|uniref:Uncharacterized protein n=2 Tax=Phaeosphaeria nodorum (strain SN15 / ATCC MYA-4574 / FGSC 10173) TaxID=321614 RepID=A0A7U2HU59_PHANO|nr:hypothetical protein SNOG_09828 [Parastagonospora nodorum SN15]KAH3920507.1 hypothetical protein HBH56_005460 [Parastagonospora nodorum]EAT83093.1 hypothetical protein SNOG_09828 [Parastagonospora nodorum SN15]KAH3938212.1 hypothetical protein HBH54_005450 [Parastagonospora nodorum]KAH3946751.1 hypothetical protein HBH53_126510 [Parastagonospora nodorum]KAH3974936.1 hypothetical protein HBH51_088210 [Parastagonospora nodorum]
MAVQDPNFWRRFSTAVHQDDVQKGTPHLKHSYVDSSPRPISSAPMSPTSQCQLFTPTSPVFAPSALRSAQVSTPPPALTRDAVWNDSEQPTRQPSKLKKSPSRASTRPLLHQHQRNTSSLQLTPPLPLPLPQPNAPFRTHSSGLRSPSLISLSGRPREVFRTWTTITGPANHGACSGSWLASQKKKSRQRTWLCWCFWLGLMGLVAGVVTAVLILRREGILKF